MDEVGRVAFPVMLGAGLAPAVRFPGQHRHILGDGLGAQEGRDLRGQPFHGQAADPFMAPGPPGLGRGRGDEGEGGEAGGGEARRQGVGHGGGTPFGRRTYPAFLRFMRRRRDGPGPR